MERAELHTRAVELARRILNADARNREPHAPNIPESARVFTDMVELAKQFLRENEPRYLPQAA